MNTVLKYSGCVVGGMLVAAAISTPYKRSPMPTVAATTQAVTPRAPDIASVKRAVSDLMRDPSSVSFGKVWQGHDNVVCGYASGRNGFGAMGVQTRFIGQNDYFGTVTVRVIPDADSAGASTWRMSCSSSGGF